MRSITGGHEAIVTFYDDCETTEEYCGKAR